MSGRPLLSVVVPCYFTEPTIDELYRRLKSVLDPLRPGLDHELVFVNDGSTDGTMAALGRLAATDTRVRALDLSRNFGHQVAITAGIDAARGDVVVVIDDDLQDPPEVIARDAREWREGYKVVYGVRSRRKGESAFKRATAKLFYRLLGRLSETRIPLDTGDFRLMDRAGGGRAQAHARGEPLRARHGRVDRLPPVRPAVRARRALRRRRRTTRSARWSSSPSPAS